MVLDQQQVQQAEASTAKESYIHRMLVGLDQAANVILGGDPDETISARSQRAAARGGLLGKFMCWWLDKLQPDHGMLAEAGDLERAETVEQIEEQALSQQEGCGIAQRETSGAYSCTRERGHDGPCAAIPAKK